jgi:hypothetical protein
MRCRVLVEECNGKMMITSGSGRHFVARRHSLVALTIVGRAVVVAVTVGTVIVIIVVVVAAVDGRPPLVHMVVLNPLFFHQKEKSADGWPPRLIRSSSCSTGIATFR